MPLLSLMDDRYPPFIRVGSSRRGVKTLFFVNYGIHYEKHYGIFGLRQCIEIFDNWSRDKSVKRGGGKHNVLYSAITNHTKDLNQ